MTIVNCEYFCRVIAKNGVSDQDPDSKSDCTVVGSTTEGGSWTNYSYPSLKYIIIVLLIIYC